MTVHWQTDQFPLFMLPSAPSSKLSNAAWFNWSTWARWISGATNVRSWTLKSGNNDWKNMDNGDASGNKRDLFDMTGRL